MIRVTIGIGGDDTLVAKEAVAMAIERLGSVRVVKAENGKEADREKSKPTAQAGLSS